MSCCIMDLRRFRIIPPQRPIIPTLRPYTVDMYAGMQSAGCTPLPAHNALAVTEYRTMSTPKGCLYDYERQAWVVDGRYDDCGHPEHVECVCYGRLHAGEQATRETMDRMNGQLWERVS